MLPEQQAIRQEALKIQSNKLQEVPPLLARELQEKARERLAQMERDTAEALRLLHEHPERRPQFHPDWRERLARIQAARRERQAGQAPPIQAKQAVVPHQDGTQATQDSEGHPTEPARLLQPGEPGYSEQQSRIAQAAWRRRDYEAPPRKDEPTLFEPSNRHTGRLKR